MPNDNSPKNKLISKISQRLLMVALGAGIGFAGLTAAGAISTSPFTHQASQRQLSASEASFAPALDQPDTPLPFFDGDGNVVKSSDGKIALLDQAKADIVVADIAKQYPDGLLEDGSTAMIQYSDYIPELEAAGAIEYVDPEGSATGFAQYCDADNALTGTCAFDH